MDQEEKDYWSNQEFLFELLQRLPAHVFWKDVNGVFVGCNVVFAQSVGFNSPEELIGKTDYDLHAKPEEVEHFLKYDKQVMATREPRLNIEEKITIPGRPTFTILTNKVPLIAKSSKVMGVLGYYFDITERKNMEVDLRVAKGKAEAASYAKSEFLANMSHDIRTPLSGIIGLSETLAYKEKDPQLKNNLQIICTSGVKLLELFDSCLEVCRLDEIDNVLQNEPFSLRTLLEDLAALFLPAVRAKNITFDLHYEAGMLDTWRGSRVTSYRILQNIIGNAIKFTHQGSITISVHVEGLCIQNKKNVIFEIEDTGIGIPKDKFEVIFNKFSRIHSSYEGVYEGTGMGLYMVKQYLKILQGDIIVNSVEGKGSKFTVTLPLELI